MIRFLFFFDETGGVCTPTGILLKKKRDNKVSSKQLQAGMNNAP
jgi:hypothetical protein